MVVQSLTDLSPQKKAIVTAIGNKITNGLYSQDLHDSFKPSKFDLNDIESIINSIENRVRVIEVIAYTYFYSEYDSSIIVNGTMPGGTLSPKIIETEFDYGTNVMQNRISINTPILYREIIDINFQFLIIKISSLYEVFVRLCETLLKKIVLYDGERVPYQSITLKTFILNWDKLVDLGYRKNDDFYLCLYPSEQVRMDYSSSYRVVKAISLPSALA